MCKAHFHPLAVIISPFHAVGMQWGSKFTFFLKYFFWGGDSAGRTPWREHCSSNLDYKPSRPLQQFMWEEVPTSTDLESLLNWDGMKYQLPQIYSQCWTETGWSTNFHRSTVSAKPRPGEVPTSTDLESLLNRDRVKYQLPQIYSQCWIETGWGTNFHRSTVSAKPRQGEVPTSTDLESLLNRDRVKYQLPQIYSQC
jgi:hypothetical protein